MIVAHTPDADDAFMFYGMLKGKTATRMRIKHVVDDIESLNRRAFSGEMDVTALSVHAYAFLHTRYRILSAGASIGEGYGPVVVAGEAMEIGGKRIGVPGKYTTANLVLSLAVDADFTPVEMRFEEVIPALKRGDVDAGVLIHEAQLTYRAHGLVKILDLGEWWHEKTHLPLPLGLNCIKRTIPMDQQLQFLESMRESVQYALEHVDEALEYAMRYSRGAKEEQMRQFVLMYVNRSTYEMPGEAIKALNVLYERAERAGIITKPPLDILFPAVGCKS